MIWENFLLFGALRKTWVCRANKIEFHLPFLLVILSNRATILYWPWMCQSNELSRPSRLGNKGIKDVKIWICKSFPLSSASSCKWIHQSRAQETVNCTVQKPKKDQDYCELYPYSNFKVRYYRRYMDRDINRNLCVTSEKSDDRTTENCLYLYRLKRT